MNKIHALRATFDAKRIDAFVSFNDINISYLTDFAASESWLFLTSNKNYYITDSRYTEEAKLGLKGVVVKELKKSHAHLLFELAMRAGIKRLGFDDRHLSHARYKAIKKLCPKSIKLVSVQDMVEQFRIIKEGEEVDCIREALKIHRAALKYLEKQFKVGATEQDLLIKLENWVRKRGVTFSFSPIIASGPNSAFPHASVTDKKLRKNESILVDMGINYKGYMSDLTRMYVLGRMHKPFEEVVEHVTHAQRVAIDFIKAGVSAKDVDAQARNYLKTKGLAKYFGHSLGHGVGREIHEQPRLSHLSQTILRENMIITVEPGVYLPGKFGVRIEDMVRVTKEGCEVL